MASSRRTSRKPGDSRKFQSVLSKSTPMSPRARAPASRGGRKGRTPVAEARPAPCPMSMASATRATLASAELPLHGHPAATIHFARPGALRRAVCLAHARDDLIGHARPDGDRRSPRGDLARRRPAGHLDFPPDTFAAVTNRIAAESCAKALQYGPTEGLQETKDCIAEVMGAEGMTVDRDDLVVTTGGQQVIDLVCKTLIEPGDVIIAEGPTYPGAVPTFSAYQADVVQIDMDAEGMQVDVMEETLDRLEREGRTPKFVYTVPSFQNPGGGDHVHRAAPAAGGGRARARAAGARGQPLRPAALRGRGATAAVQARRRRVRDVPRTFSKILSPGIRLGWVAAPPPVLEKINLGKQAVDLCTSTLSQLMVQAYFEQRPLARVRRVAHRHLPAPPGCDARRAGGSLPAPGRVDRAGRRPVHLGDAAGLHRHHRPPGPGAARQRRVRARAPAPTSTAAGTPRCG